MYRHENAGCLGERFDQYVGEKTLQNSDQKGRLWVLDVTCLFGLFSLFEPCGSFGDFCRRFDASFSSCFLRGPLPRFGSALPACCPSDCHPCPVARRLALHAHVGLALRRIRMPSITGESRRFIDLVTFYLPLTPRRSPPSCCCSCRLPGVCGSRGWPCAGGGGCGTLCCRPLPCPVRREARGSLTSQTGGQGERVPRVVPAPSQRGCQAARMDAQAGPQRADQRQKARPRAGCSGDG